MAEVDIPDEAMKRRRVNPVMIVLGLAIAGLGGGLLWFGVSKDVAKMTTEERMEVQSNIFVLPAKDQIVEWRKYAGDTSAPVELRAEALAQLGLLGDEEQGIKLATDALQDANHGLRGTAAMVLAHFGPEKAGGAKPALLTALKEANEGDRRQVLWALVELGEASIFEQAIESYKANEITTVQRLSGGTAFDPMKMTKLVSLDELAKMAADKSDENAAVRQLVATLVSQNAEAKWTDLLIELVKDPSLPVRGEAAVGLGKIADERARGPLLDALKTADKDARKKYLEALRDGMGGEGLVLALETVVPESENESRNWFQHEQIFNMLHQLADPRVGDSMVAWVEKTKPFIHWRTEAGMVLAEAGDVRGAKYLAERMDKENKDLYVREKFWQKDRGGHLSRSDQQRVEAARMLADLAKLHPDKREQLRDVAEGPVITWSTSNLAPHANALRFLSQVGSEKGAKLIIDWAFPDEPLPEPGVRELPKPFEIAQSALRYTGVLKKERGKLLDQFDRKEDEKLDITQQALMGAGVSVLAMSLRALAVGASHGLAEWGPADDKAPETLIAFIEDKKWHEEARMAACDALGWVATDGDIKKVVEKVKKYSASAEGKDQWIASCFSQTLSIKPNPQAVGTMVDALRRELGVNVRVGIGRAIGNTGLEGDQASIDKLLEKMKDEELRNAAGLALMMGGTADVAARAVALYGKVGDKLAINVFKDHWFNAFGYWSDQDLTRGNIFRYVENAQAVARVKVGDAPQTWATQRLQRQFDNLQIDNGPHSETIVVLRYRLYNMAKKEPERAAQIIDTLKFIGAQGPLLALRSEEGETGELARDAYHRMMNPVLFAEDISYLEKK
ncbi:MAG: HEAT repeat domain-containing protein [Myxococcota bacterium]